MTERICDFFIGDVGKKADDEVENKIIGLPSQQPPERPDDSVYGCLGGIALE